MKSRPFTASHSGTGLHSMPPIITGLLRTVLDSPQSGPCRPPARASATLMSVATELELKYSVADSRFPAANELAAAAAQAGWTLTELDPVDQHDRYFDDEARSIKASGLALRQRAAEGRTIAALKAAGQVAGALHRRDELELNTDGTTWPDEILDRLSGVASPASLRTFLELRTKRQRYLAQLASGARAEIFLDDVTAFAPELATSVHFLEVEVEAAGHNHAGSLRDIGGALANVMKLTPCSVNKLERAESLLQLATGWELS